MSSLIDALPPGTVLAVLLIGIGASILAALVTFWSTVDRRRHGPAVRRLARRLRVRGVELRLLQRVARETGRSSVGPLLISQGCFDESARVFMQRHGQVARLRGLRRRLFDA